MSVYSLDNLNIFVKQIIQSLHGGGIVLLKGNLASGKTTFVKKFVEELNLDIEVSSPTFLIMNEYKNIVCHYDIYQNGIDGFLQSGLLEKLDEPKYHLIEWADEKLEEILKKMGFEFIKIEIEIIGEKRKYICTHSK